MLAERSTRWDIFICILTVVLIVYLHLSTHIFVFYPWLLAQPDGVEWGGTFLLVLVNVFVAMALWSFVMAVFTAPGTVPLDYRLGRVKGSTRWCKKCDMPRPPRAHHCSHGCDECILKMDHHCPWVANCVGFWNHGHFLRFVLYTELAALLAVVALLYRTMQLIWWPYTIPSYRPYQPQQTVPMMPISLREALVLIFNTLLLLGVVTMLGILVGMQLLNVLKNRTCIESLEIEQVQRSARRHQQPPVVYPFDLDFWSNLQLVLGRRLWAWPFPLPSSWQMAGLGDGIHYRTIDGRDPAWPPIHVAVESSDEEVDVPVIGMGKKGSAVEQEWETRSDMVLDHRKRWRRDSEGYWLPDGPIWSGFRSDTHLESRHSEHAHIGQSNLR